MRNKNALQNAQNGKRGTGAYMKKVWCLFEQSGTFKNEFKKFGFEAYDVDILNDFKQTDFEIDLFANIAAAAKGEKSLFDKIHADDLVFAFFPCTKFTEKHYMNARGDSFFLKHFDDLRKLEYSRKAIDDTHHNYTLICQLFEIALKKGFKMVVENPDAQPHFLKDFFPFKPTITIKNRAVYGDYYKKPTNFWFVNFKPSYNFIFENCEQEAKPVMSKKKIGFSGLDSKRAKEAQVHRSLISPMFANRFIREYILTEKELEDYTKGNYGD